MAKHIPMILTAGAPALAAFLWGGGAHAACPYSEGQISIECGGDTPDCGNHKIDWAKAPCRRSLGTGCQTREDHDFTVCQGCPDERRQPVPLCSSGPCNCRGGS